MGFATINISGTAKGLNLKFAHKMYIRTNILKMQKKKIEKFAVNRFYQITAEIKKSISCNLTSAINHYIKQYSAFSKSFYIAAVIAS